MYEKFQALLAKSGKTSAQVSRETGIPQNVLSYWKSGRSQPKVDKLIILSKYFGVPLEYFLDLKEGENDAES